MTLFWIGLVLALASLVFGLVLGLFGFVLSIVIMAGAWLWEKLTGKEL